MAKKNPWIEINDAFSALCDEKPVQKMEKPNCKKCRYRIHLANLCDIHVWAEDCDKYGTDLCKKMNDPDFIKFVDEGGLEDVPGHT